LTFPWSWPNTRHPPAARIVEILFRDTQRRADAINFLRACRRAASVTTTGDTVRVPAPKPKQQQDN